MKMNNASGTKQPIIVAAMISVTVNIIMLKTAALLHINVEAGGLLKLCLKLLPAKLLQDAFFHSVVFGMLFHYLTGLGLVMIYVLFVKKKLNWPGWVKGIAFSLFPWLTNGLVVLPLLGQSIFGMKQLMPTGIIYFFTCNLVFGLLLGGLAEMQRSHLIKGIQM